MPATDEQDAKRKTPPSTLPCLQTSMDMMDSGRPTVDPGILGIPQGWEDDPNVAPTASESNRVPTETPSTYPVPWRKRVKLSARTPATGLQGARQDVNTVQVADRNRSSRVNPHTRDVNSNEGHKDGLGREGRAVEPTGGAPVYQVGYDRNVMDTEARMHEAMYDLLGGHTMAVFQSPPKKVLDLGTGSGLWPLSMANSWKDSVFIGADRAPCQIDLSTWRDKLDVDRIKWQALDFLQPLPYKDRSFDFVHMRLVGLGVPEQRWPALLEEALRVLKPGGKLEIVETHYDLRIDDLAVQKAYSTFLTTHSIPDDPARAINFLLLLLDSDGEGSGARTIELQQQFEAPRGTLGEGRDVHVYGLSSLNHLHSAHPPGPSMLSACRELGWTDPPGVKHDGPLTVYVWVLTSA